MNARKKAPTGTKKSQTPSKYPINLSILPCIACFLLPLLASIWAYISVNTLSSGRINEIAQQHAESAVHNFEHLLQNYQAKADTLGLTPHLSTLITSRDRSAIAAYSIELTASLPDAIAVTLLPKGSIRTNRNIQPPINFAALEMLKSAERGATNVPEVHILDGKKILRVAAPILQASTAPSKNDPQTPNIIGTLLLSYPLEKVTAEYTRLPENAGEVTIVQKFNKSKAITLLSDGQLSGKPLAEATAHSKIPQLKAHYTLSSTFSESHFSSTLFWGVNLIAAFAALFAGLSSYFLLKKQVLKDLLALETHFKQITAGKGNKKPTYHLESFNDTSQRLLDLIDALVAAQHTRTKARAHPKAITGNRSKKQTTTESTEIDLVGIQHNEDELFGLAEESSSHSTTDTPMVDIPASIFRAYDIRGIVGETLCPQIIFQIGRAIGSETLAQGQNSITVGRDGRLSGEELSKSLIKGILSTGCNAIDIGMAPTPTLYFAAHELKTKSGVMVTGSHNPPDYNGLKIVINGTTLANEAIQALYQRIINNELEHGEGQLEERSVSQEYIDKIVEDVILARPIKVVIDCGNGVAGAIAPDLFSHLGCEVIPLYCDVDGNFPNHHPDPSQPKNLEALINSVKKQGAELGIAFDGDGDRVGLVTASGEIIYSDRLLMLFAKDLLSRNPGADIIFDIKCTRDLADLISSLGGRPIMWKTGHSLIKAKLKETGAVLAGEMSGHIFFNDRWYGFDDALYSAARLLEIISMESLTTDEMFNEFPIKESTPELNIAVAEERKFKIVEQLKSTGNFGNGKVTDIDGIRVDYNDAWGLLRASNTTPMLVARFEGDTPEALEKVKSTFRNSLQSVDSGLDIPF